jgi:hypothetical protein
MADQYDDWDQAYHQPVTVTCPASGIGYPESEVKILDVSEDIQGFDVVVFECPECNINHRSYRRG